jgi:Peptidase family M23
MTTSLHKKVGPERSRPRDGHSKNRKPVVIYLALFQTLVPAALLAWLSLFPMRNRWAYMVQMLCVGLVLAAFALVGLWMLPPWWVPYLFGAVFVLIVAGQRLRSMSGAGRQSESRSNLLALGAAALIAAYATYLGIAGLIGRSPAGQTVVNITMPLAQGSYLIAQGGSNKTVNEHYTTLDETVPRYAAWRGQSKGLDIIRIDRFGFRASGLMPENPAEYYTFDAPVLAPCDGPVVVALDGVRDMPIPQMDREHLLGNHAIIQCDGFFVVLAHFKEGSILVSKGQMVRAGDKLGGMGNSGNSAEPHLHIHAQRDLPASAPISGEPLALSIDGKFYVRNDRIVVE